jgi:hypothetical protein
VYKNLRKYRRPHVRCDMREQAWNPGVAWLRQALASQVMFSEIFPAPRIDRIFLRQRRFLSLQMSRIERSPRDYGNSAHHFMRGSGVVNAPHQLSAMKP